MERAAASLVVVTNKVLSKSECLDREMIFFRRGEDTREIERL